MLAASAADHDGTAVDTGGSVPLRAARRHSPDDELSRELLCEFFAEGMAVPQPRPSEGGGHRIMAPAKHAIRGWRDNVRAAAQRAMNGRPPVIGAVRFYAVFRFRRPKRLCLQRGERRPGSGEAYVDEVARHVSDPDWDNIGKAVSDALKGVCWVDDCQVWSGHVEKLYCHVGETPGVDVRVYRDA